VYRRSVPPCQISAWSKTNPNPKPTGSSYCLGVIFNWYTGTDEMRKFLKDTNQKRLNRKLIPKTRWRMSKWVDNKIRVIEQDSIHFKLHVVHISWLSFITPNICSISETIYKTRINQSINQSKQIYSAPYVATRERIRGTWVPEIMSSSL